VICQWCEFLAWPKKAYENQRWLTWCLGGFGTNYVILKNAKKKSSPKTFLKKNFLWRKMEILLKCSKVFYFQNENFKLNWLFGGNVLTLPYCDIHNIKIQICKSSIINFWIKTHFFLIWVFPYEKIYSMAWETYTKCHYKKCMKKHIQWHAKIHGKVEICTIKIVEYMKSLN